MHSSATQNESVGSHRFDKEVFRFVVTQPVKQDSLDVWSLDSEFLLVGAEELEVLQTDTVFGDHDVLVSLVN